MAGLADDRTDASSGGIGEGPLPGVRAGAGSEPSAPDAQGMPPGGGGWERVRREVHHLTLTMSMDCEHCGAPIPVNGPARVVHCANCLRDTPIPSLPSHLCEAAGGSHLLGVGSSWRTFDAPEPQCSKCQRGVPIGQYLPYHGATTTLACPFCNAPLPTFPVPSWLRALLPTAVQVFGADPGVANAEAGLDLRLNQARSQPVVMACPNCGGGLSIDEDSPRTVPCEYCNASVFLPDDLWRRMHPVKTMQRWTLTYVERLVTADELAEWNRAWEENQAEKKERQKQFRLRSEDSEADGFADVALPATRVAGDPRLKNVLLLVLLSLIAGVLVLGACEALLPR